MPKPFAGAVGDGDGLVPYDTHAVPCVRGLGLRVAEWLGCAFKLRSALHNTTARATMKFGTMKFGTGSTVRATMKFGTGWAKH